MAYSPEQRDILLAVKGVGPTVIERLEQIGIDSLESLARADAQTIADTVAAMLGSRCWKNSPRAREAVAAAIERAREQALG